MRSQIAYVMATVEHEVAATYRPIREFGGANRWYAPYYGRGYVQLTHRSNYQKYSNLLGIDLVSNPDRALEPRIALFVLVHGMATGNFTGRRLGQYVNVNRTDFVGARWVVNDRDRRHHIANLANRWNNTILNGFSFAPESVGLTLEGIAPEGSELEFIEENTPTISEEDRLIFELIGNP